jgi:hypothetical protein
LSHFGQNRAIVLAAANGHKPFFGPADVAMRSSLTLRFVI